MLSKRGSSIDFDIRRVNFKDFSIVTISNQDESLSRNAIFHCPVGFESKVANFSVYQWNVMSHIGKFPF